MKHLNCDSCLDFDLAISFPFLYIMIVYAKKKNCKLYTTFNNDVLQVAQLVSVDLFLNTQNK